MKKTLSSAFAVMVLAVSAVALTAPAVADPGGFGGIHLHVAGKAGQKAVGSTIIFGAEGLKGVPQNQSGNSCLAITRSIVGKGYGMSLSPIPTGWDQQCPKQVPGVGKTFQLPSSGSFAYRVPLPDLPPGEYQLLFSAIADHAPGTGNPVLLVSIQIEADGSFSKVCNSMKNYGTPEYCRSQ